MASVASGYRRGQTCFGVFEAQLRIALHLLVVAFLPVVTRSIAELSFSTMERKIIVIIEKLSP